MKLISISEASKRSGVSRQTLLNWCRSGVLRFSKTGRAGNSYWVDVSAIDALSGTMSDIERTKTLLESARSELRSLYDEERAVLNDVRREVFMLKKFGKSVTAREFYMSIPVMLRELDVITDREAAIMCHIVAGDDMGFVSEKFGVTRTRILQIFLKGCRKARVLGDFANVFKENSRLKREVEHMDKKFEEDSKYIKELEDRLAMENRPADERTSKLMGKRLVDCDLSVRTLNCLKAADIDTIGDLIQLEKRALLQIRNFGKKSLFELEDCLQSLGLEWGDKTLVQKYDTSSSGYRYFSGYMVVDKLQGDRR